MEFTKKLKAWFLENFTLKGTYVPLVAKYKSFEVREVIYECRITKKRVKAEEYSNYYKNTEFSIPTTNFIEAKEFDEILNGAPLTDYPHLTFYNENR